MLEVILKTDRIKGEAIEALWPVVDRILVRQFAALHPALHPGSH
jgi:hypothetical protein